MSLTKLIITDLTRMEGARVCIAGINEQGQTIRPVFDHKIIDEEWLFIGGLPCIIPFAQIQFDLVGAIPDAPHTEDWIVRNDFKRFLGYLPGRDRLKFLQSIIYPSVESIFETEVMHQNGYGYFIPHGSGIRSLGTISPRRFYDFVHIRYESGTLDYRLGFQDQDGHNYRLKITDLAFRYYVNHLRTQENLSFEQISDDISEMVKSREVFLRIGLARPTWAQHPNFCHLQINAVHMFPDHLTGRCFADFRPN